MGVLTAAGVRGCENELLPGEAVEDEKLVRRRYQDAFSCTHWVFVFHHCLRRDFQGFRCCSCEIEKLTFVLLPLVQMTQLNWR